MMVDKRIGKSRRMKQTDWASRSVPFTDRQESHLLPMVTYFIEPIKKLNKCNAKVGLEPSFAIGWVR